MIIGYYVMILAVLFVLLSARMHPLRLPKLMYLCPMSKEERRAYLHRAWRVRVTFDFAIAMIPVLIALVTGLADGWVAANVTLSVLCLGLCSSVREMFIPGGNNGAMTLNYSGAGGVAAGIVCILSYITGACGLIVSPQNGGETILAGIFLGVELLVELPLTIKVLAGRDAAIEQALDYESVYADGGR